MSAKKVGKSSKKNIEEVVEDTVNLSNESSEEVTHNETKTLKEKTSFHLSKLVSTRKRKILTIVASVLILLVIFLAIPFTRYAILSPFIKKDVTLTIIDSKTKKPVTDVSVEVGGVSAQSNKDGIVKLESVPVGDYDLKVTKQYYQDYTQDYTVTVLAASQSPTINIVAAGRQVQVSISNKITGDPLGDVTIESSGTKATTNGEGMATIILPPTDDDVKAVLKKDGYNSTEVELKVDDATVNAYSISPSGSIYYLSKATGKINVMKSNLDGTNAVTVVAGTGQENDYETSLLSSRDWKYSALSATRTDNKQRLYLIDSSKDEQSVLDEGNATFDMVGWSGHNFIYIVHRKTANGWDDKRDALKSFNADTRKITTLDETSGSGNSYDYSTEYFSGTYILKDEIVYTKIWNFGYYANRASKASTLYSVKSTGGSKKIIKAFADSVVNTKLYEPQGLYIKVNGDNGNATSVFYEYEEGAIKEVKDTNDNQFYAFYPTFLISPSGNQTLWYEPRDGKNTVFVGDDEGKEPKTIGNLSEYTPYGWYGEKDEYVLLTKKGSELYVSSSTKVIAEGGYQPLKVTDYHKTRTYPGYGYGYGGQ